MEAASADLAVSAIAVNFAPDPGRALAEMARAVRPGGRVCFYVWDYPGRGVGFMRAFWDAAIALDPGAADLSEDRRFPFCRPEALTDLARAVGLADIVCAAIETEAVFSDFDDFWRPFTLGAGPAPGYCASLAPAARESLRRALLSRLRPREDASIAFGLRAWSVLSRVP